MKNTITATDIQLMLHLFAPKQYNLFIFDPLNILVNDQDINFSSGDENDPMILVSLADEVICYKDLQLNDFEMIFDFGKSKIKSCFEQKKFNFVNNPDGTMRWLFPQGKLKSALQFYNVAGLRSKLIASVYRVLGTLKLGRLVSSGSLVINYRRKLKLEDSLKEITYDSYSIFTGTKGYDRTAVVALEKDCTVTHFAKIALNTHGLCLLKNEKEQLQMYNYMKFEGLSVPDVVHSSDPNILIVTNETEKGMIRCTSILSTHIRVLTNIFKKSRMIFPIQSTTFWEKTLNNLSLLKTKSIHSKVEDIKMALFQLKKEIDPKKNILVTLAHSDFTPWNIKVGHQKLYVYDWEMAQYKAPALFDIFHFHMQNGIFLKKHNLDQIMHEIYLTCNKPQIKQIIDTHHINILYYFKLYLLKTISYYLAAFQLQRELTADQESQLRLWKLALSANINIDYSLSFRKLFINEFYKELLKSPHAMLKFEANSLDNLSESSDLDIAILKEDLPAITEYCKTHRLIHRIKLINKSFMTTISLFFKDGSFLSLDLISQFKRKQKQMMAIEPVLISAVPNRYGVIVPARRFDMEYTLLFYSLNNAKVPQKYYTYFGSENYAERGSGIDYLNNKYNLNMHSYSAFFNLDIIQRKMIKKIVSKQLFQPFYKKLTNTFNYFLDTFKDLFQNRGFIITLNGVDGAGKSTIVERVGAEIKSQYRKDVVMLRHRPGVFPILSSMVHGSKAKAEKIASETPPRMGTNRSFLSSFLRFGYYYCDYMIGQIYVYFRYVLRGKIVLYDRYYFDFITDSERSNIRLNKRFIKLLYLFVIKPRLNVLLWAGPQHIYKRKQELDQKTIKRLTTKYKRLFSEFNNKYGKSKYRVIENIRIDQTVSNIMSEFARII